MADMHEKKEAVELPLDTRLLSDAVIELNISRKNVGIYPPGHIQITKSIDRAYEILQRMFEIRPEMTLGVAKDTLVVGRDYLDQRNPVYRDFALSMNQQGIAAVTFIKGLDRDELTRFHRVLTTRPEDIRAAGGIEKVIEEAAIQHIRIKAVDYGSFHLTEESEIIRPASKKEKAASTIWQDFVSNLVADTLAGPGKGPSVDDTSMIDPKELAKLLNERRLQSRAAVESYERIITEYVRYVAERKQPTKEQSATLAKLNSLVKELHPELRKQFLSTAFRHIATESRTRPEDLLGGFPDDMVIEMLRNASEEGREISPTLAGLMQKLASVGVKEDARPGPAQSPEIKSAPVITEDKMKRLFDRETYEQYVGEDYDATLKALTERSLSPLGLGGGVSDFPIEEYLESLEDRHLDFQIGRALLAFMEEDIDEEDYAEFSRKLIDVMPDLLESGNFYLLLDILETLRRHSKEKPQPKVREHAEKVLEVFSDQGFVNQAVSAFDRWARTKGREAADFLLALGPAAVPGLMDLFSMDETPGGRKLLFDLLCNFGEPTLNEAVKRLGDPRPFFVRNLVMLIRSAGRSAHAVHIKPLLNHPDQKVRLEVIAALLRFKDHAAIQLLREALRSKDPDVASQAVFIAGQYRVSAVTEDLLSMIKKVILFEADYTVNEEIIKALGEIGDPRAVPELERLAKTSWSLYPQGLAKMKLTLFESLSRYPRESMEGLIKIGERSEDERIRRIAKKLAEKRG